MLYLCYIFLLGIKLGRRPKVDSDAFQHGFYPPTDGDYPPPGFWAAMEHPPHPMFKTEPVFSESDEPRERLMYGDVGNYAMKPEPYATCGQTPAGHYGQDMYGVNDNGQVNGHLSESNWTKSDRHLSMYPHPHMPPEMYAIRQHHSQGTQAQKWTSELSPTTSGSGSEDNWDGGVLHNRGIPSSVSLTLPEVQSGAAAAMAYANLYRGKNDAIATDKKENAFKCKDELAVHQDACKSNNNSTSYTELVPRKTENKTEISSADFSNCDQSVNLYQKTDQSVALYHQEPKSHTLHSPTRGGTGSTSPHHHTSTGIDSNGVWLDPSTPPRPTKRRSPTPTSESHGSKSRKLTSQSQSKNTDDEGSIQTCTTEHVQLIQELIDNYVPLEGVVIYQWETYQQGYGEVCSQTT